MALDRDAPPRDPNGVLDLKTVLGAAVGLITILGGLAWGIWTRGIEADITELRGANGKQWERLRELNDQGIKRDAEIEQLKKEGADRETRVRDLERKWK